MSENTQIFIEIGELRRQLDELNQNVEGNKEQIAQFEETLNNYQEMLQDVIGYIQELKTPETPLKGITVLFKQSIGGLEFLFRNFSSIR